MNTPIKTLFLLIAVLGPGACSTQTVKSTTLIPVVVDTAPIPESELLDIGIAIFDPGLDDIAPNREELTFADVRMAETQYVSYMLAQTLQSNGNWGVVRVVPNEISYYDVAIHGTILQSDGETMLVHVKVNDVTGKTWIDKDYEEVVSKFNYDPRLRRTDDSFQNLYNRIANDILAYRQKNMESEDLLNIRTISKLQFARSFAPQVFDRYVETGRNGIIEVQSLPASNDPLLTRLDTIRERDYLYVDALQDHYVNFARQMQGPYTEFRKQSYEEVMKYDQLVAKSKRNMVLGVAAVLGGLAGAYNANNNGQLYTSYGGLFGGGFLIKDAFAKRDEAQMQAEALAELGNSLGTEIAPQTIELEEKIVTLSGTVDAQYAQWREILADLYANETGAPVSQEPPAVSEANQ
jgi:hypothetical protein